MATCFWAHLTSRQNIPRHRTKLLSLNIIIFSSPFLCCMGIVHLHFCLSECPISKNYIELNLDIVGAIIHNASSVSQIILRAIALSCIKYLYSFSCLVSSIAEGCYNWCNITFGVHCFVKNYKPCCSLYNDCTPVLQFIYNAKWLHGLHADFLHSRADVLILHGHLRKSIQIANGKVHWNHLQYQAHAAWYVFRRFCRVIVIFLLWHEHSSWYTTLEI